MVFCFRQCLPTHSYTTASCAFRLQSVAASRLSPSQSVYGRVPHLCSCVFTISVVHGLTSLSVIFQVKMTGAFFTRFSQSLVLNTSTSEKKSHHSKVTGKMSEKSKKEKNQNFAFFNGVLDIRQCGKRRPTRSRSYALMWHSTR